MQNTLPSFSPSENNKDVFSKWLLTVSMLDILRCVSSPHGHHAVSLLALLLFLISKMGDFLF